METLTTKEVRGLHFRSIFIGSFLSGVGFAAFFSLLFLIAASIGHQHGTQADLWKEVLTVAGMYGAIGSAAFGLLGLVLQGVSTLFSRETNNVNNFMSHFLAVSAGALLGAGLIIWEIMIIPATRLGEGFLFFVFLGVIAMLASFLTSGLWKALSALVGIRKTETGKALSNNLANYAAWGSLIPWGYLLFSIVIGGIR